MKNQIKVAMDKVKNLLFGKYRSLPCIKCGSPYHLTKDHKWYH